MTRVKESKTFLAGPAFSGFVFASLLTLGYLNGFFWFLFACEVCFCKRKALEKGTSFPVASCVLQPLPWARRDVSSGRGDMLPSAAREVPFPLTKAGQCGSLTLWRIWQGFLSPQTPGIYEVVLLKRREGPRIVGLAYRARMKLPICWS